MSGYFLLNAGMIWSCQIFRSSLRQLSMTSFVFAPAGAAGAVVGWVWAGAAGACVAGAAPPPPHADITKATSSNTLNHAYLRIFSLLWDRVFSTVPSTID